ERLNPVALFVAVTVTPGNAAPDSSVTRPPSDAPPVWARTADAANSKIRVRTKRVIDLFMMDLLTDPKLSRTIDQVTACRVVGREESAPLYAGRRNAFLSGDG